MTSVEVGVEQPIVVLLAEDEVLIRMLTADVLVDAGYRVIEASTAEEALALLEARADVRLLVTDVKMPGKLDGLALARLVGSRWPQVGIVITSGHALAGDEEVPEGTLFLVKPVKFESLLAHLLALTAGTTGAPVIAPDDAVVVPDPAAASEALSSITVADATARPKLEKDGEAEA